MQDETSSPLNAADSLSAQVAQLLQENRQILSELQTVKEDLVGIRSFLAKKLAPVDKAIQDRIESMFQVQERDNLTLWTTASTLKNIPSFIPREERPVGENGVSTRFISFINFKGGVGKTTLSANLTAAFASGKYNLPGLAWGNPLRTLVVDTDFQGTLTDRCVEPFERMNLDKRRLTSARLLTLPKYSNVTLKELRAPFIHCPNAWLIAASDELDRADMKEQTRLALKTADTRFFYRFWFHNEDFLKDYDLVIFDCPPRLTTSSVCALAVSDYAFIPTAPESFDVHAVNRTVSFIIQLCWRLNLPLQIGGVIINRTAASTRLQPAEQEFVSKLQVFLNDLLGKDSEDSKSYVKKYGAPTILKSFLPKKVGKKSINGDEGAPLPGADGSNESLSDIASEIYERIY